MIKPEPTIEDIMNFEQLSQFGALPGESFIIKCDWHEGIHDVFNTQDGYHMRYGADRTRITNHAGTWNLRLDERTGEHEVYLIESSGKPLLKGHNYAPAVQQVIAGHPVITETILRDLDLAMQEHFEENSPGIRYIPPDGREPRLGY